jgi:hypothetical protein
MPWALKKLPQSQKSQNNTFNVKLKGIATLFVILSEKAGEKNPRSHRALPLSG